MKKIISLATLFSVALVLLGVFLFPSLVKEGLGAVGLSFIPKTAEAQNIGTLRNVVTSGFSFKKDLMLGDTDPDVRELQRVLNADIDTMIVSEDVGSRGKEGTYFGAATKAAVIKFQNKYKDIVLTLNSITTADGAVNKPTRTRLNLLLGVMNTYDSVGFPQSRASSQVVVVPAPTIVTPSAGTSMGICQFVELMISIGAVSPDRVNSARTAMSCPMGVFVDLKVNGQDGTAVVSANSTVTISWTSSGVTSCTNGGANKTLSGSETYNIGTVSRSFSFTCRTSAGASVMDTVYVDVTGYTPNDQTAPILLSSSYTLFACTSALYEIDTNVPTKAYLTYRTNSTDAQTISLTDLQSARLGSIPNLLPSTTYYYTLKIVDASGNQFTTVETSKTTSSCQSATSTPDVASSTLVQKVLYSSDGAGIMSVNGSASLKLTSKVTLEAWVKPTKWSTTNGISGTKDQVIISKGKIGDNIDYALTLDNGKLVYSNNDASMYTCSPVVPLNQWTHVAVSVNEATSTVNLYVNGVKMGATSTASTTGLVASSTIATSTASTTSAICESSRGVFKHAEKINKGNAITNVVTSFIDQPSATSGGVTASSTTDQIMAAIAAMGSSNNTVVNPTSNLYIGNFYPKMCLANNAIPKDNGFIGSLDDIRIWKVARTDDQIKDNMRKSVKDSPDLVAYYTFDDGFGSDVSSELNTGEIKGTFEVTDDATATSTTVISDFSTGEGFTVYDPCDVAPPPPPEEEEPDYNVQFAGEIMSVEVCSDKPAYRVVIKGCTGSPVSRLAPNASAAAIETRDASYYNNANGLIVVNVPKNLANPQPQNKTMVFGGTANGAWDEVCAVAKYDPSNPLSHDDAYGTVTRSGSDNSPLTVNSFYLGGKAAKSVGRVKSWDVGKRMVDTCIGYGHSNGWKFF